MKKKVYQYRLLFLYLIVGLFLSSCGTVSETISTTKPDADKETIVFLHTNDHHFDINYLEELTAKISEIRSQYDQVYLFDAGDIFVRHPHRWVENGLPAADHDWYLERALLIVHTMNALQYDAMTLGNHEFDYVSDHTLTALETADFPLLSANVKVSTDQLPTPLSHLFFQTASDHRIAVLGLSVTSGSKEGIQQGDIFETAKDYMYLRDEADIFIALTHIGLANDIRLSEEFPQIDVVIGGHSHHLIEEAVLVNGVLVAQAGGNPHEVSDDHPVYLGKIILTLENGVITEKRGTIIFFPDYE